MKNISIEEINSKAKIIFRFFRVGILFFGKAMLYKCTTNLFHILTAYLYMIYTYFKVFYLFSSGKNM